MDMDFILIFNVVTSAIPSASGENACRPSLNSQSDLVFLYILIKEVNTFSHVGVSIVAIEGLKKVLL